MSCQFFYLFFLLVSLAILFEDDPYDPCYRDSEYDPEDSAERGSEKHDDEYKKWREIERFAHHIGDEDIVLCLLYDDIEYDYDRRDFPGYPESDDRSRYECEERSYIRDEFHDTSDKGESESLLEREPEDSLHESQSYICEKKYTQRKCQHPSYPSSEYMLDPRIVTLCVVAKV